MSFLVSTGGSVGINRISLQRADTVATGLKWYSTGNKAWQEYMAPPGAGQGYDGDLTAPTGTYVTSWARRSFIENVSGYGWTWEAHTLNSLTPSIVAELSSATGNFKTIGSLVAPNVLTGRIIASSQNLHLDGNSGADGVYVGYYSGTGGLRVCNGSQVVKLTIAGGDGRIDSAYGGSALVAAGGTSQYGGFHFNAHPDDMMVGFTSAATSSGTQGGVLIQGSGSYGTKIRFLTTNSYAQGAKLSMTLDPVGNLMMDRDGSIYYAASLVTNNSTLHLGTGSSPWNHGAQTSAGAFRSVIAGDTKFMFCGDNGTMSVYADGKFYQNEGQYQVIDTSGGTLSGDLVGTTMQGNFRVYSSPTDKIDGSPWYGLGASTGVDLSAGGGVSATHLAGFYGLRLRSQGNIIDIFRTDDIVHRTVKTSTFYSTTAATTTAYANSAAIQIREVGTVGAAQSSHAYAPKIGFHWAGRVAGNLVFDSSGNYRFMDADCNAHMGVCASAFWGSLKPGGTGNVSLDEGNGRSMKITNAYGYLELGSQNSDYAHYITDRGSHYFNVSIAVNGNLRVYNTNTYLNTSTLSMHAGDGYGIRFWNGADGYSISMSSTTTAAYGGGGIGVSNGTDYNMVFRMEGTGGRTGGDYTRRGFLYKNDVNGAYAHMVPLGNYTYWGGVLALKDCGNNKWYGIYFVNGAMYVKEMYTT
jgi:hypothetical protein